ncbi:DUF433 domain-containing protein [Nocardia sp. alder85J]|uniref:DUF433 domain-containing protein n=1 Tax=Nocardia sp. alder85J TaxID=2862949 RepID=UPI001CD2A0B4|nr:DUF433 domain-containing protein [Nocardia sp. alder85J]MCX4093148.1 DUF433 domain-containing protein [Nocardia sp. alder85J]
MADVFYDALFTPADVSHQLVVPKRTVYSWLSADADGHRLVHRLPPERGSRVTIPFIGLVEVYVLRALHTELRFGTARTHAAVADLRARFGTEYALGNERIATDGIDLLVEYSDGEPARVHGRRIPVREFVTGYLGGIDWGDSGYATRLRLPRFPATAPVVIDSRINWGGPVLQRSNVPVSAIIDLFESGEPIAVVAGEYGLDEVEVQEIVRAELA